MNTIFFDLDGTLTDPKLGITGSIQYALEKLSRDVPPADELTWCIGPPLLESFAKILGDDKTAQEAVRLFRERFTETGIFENVVYPKIPAVLDQLQKSGRQLFVATSKPAVYAERIIKHFSLDTYFERVFGSELDGTNSNKGELLAFALKETGVSTAQAAMIGDRKHDIRGARSNGLLAIGVLYGYGTEDELTEAGARHICSSPDDLLNIFD